MTSRSSGRRPRVLVVEDDAGLRRTVRRALEFGGYQVDVAVDGVNALEVLDGPEKPDLVLLDLTLPRMDGITACLEMRRRSAVPIIMVTARDSDEDIVKGLDCGADDYITKPFNVETLMAHIRAVRRRTDQKPAGRPESLEFGTLAIDFEARVVRKRGETVRLTSTEYKILERLARQPGRSFSYDEMLRFVWGPEFENSEDTRHMVQSHVNRLRRKIEPDPRHPSFVVTHPIGGYVFRAPPEMAKV